MTGATRRTGRRSGTWSLRAAVVAAALVGAVLADQAAAQAHAVLLGTEPRDGTVLEVPPDAIQLRFNEPVEVPPAGLRFFDADARQIAQGGDIRPEDPARVVLALPALPEGGYVATWRVVSADGHLVAGAFAFTVGDAAPVADAVVAELFGGGTDRALGALGSVLRWASYLGTLLAAGAVLFAVSVAVSDEERHRARRVALPAAVLGVAATALALPVQALAVTGAGLLDVVRPGGGLDLVLLSSFGQSTALRLLGLGLVALAWRHGPGPRWVAFPALFAAASFALDGHQRSADPAWLVATADAVHLVAAAVWLGGLALLASTVRQRALDDDPVGGARLVARFSTVATAALVAVAGAGLAMAWALVRVPRGLLATGYGQLLLVKLGIVALVVAVGAYNRWRLMPAVAARLGPAGGSVDTPSETRPVVERRSRAAWRQLAGTATVELGLVVAVLGVTAFLVVERPAADQLGVTGAFETSVALTDDVDLDVVVDPNEVGRNVVHLYALDPTGRPVGTIEDLRLELTYLAEDIGPFTTEPFVAGPGHWIAVVDDLRFAGDWRLRVVAAVDRFEEVSAELTVTVQP